MRMRRSIAFDQPSRCQTRPLQRGLGGARRDRTDDILLAKQALSQLSYGPVQDRRSRGIPDEQPGLRKPQAQVMVGPGRLELPTSRLSGVRSNHLSYGPVHERQTPTKGARRKTTLQLNSSAEERETKTAISRQRPDQCSRHRIGPII